ncbi:family 20 glycosylhydrolase [Deminuibacter soli]|uniref:beta-N-acetylhexosaminidase n=1 Tax=Deminuibacter soli TaxID=2291815 RepID=A0A3E1NE61_9BACT|nr:family 20 glycosylhydrolase [Deminuibacter soli]RFM26142.1 beta-N-acetylhexosaminidase [Deminuibacter soli]
MKNLLLLAFIAVSLTGIAQKNNFNPRQLAVSWQVLENGYQGEAQSATAFTFVNKNKTPLPATGWKIYFNFGRSVLKAIDGNVTVQHENGDLYSIAPAAGFAPLAPGDSVRIGFTSEAWVVNFTDAPNGLFLVWDGASTGTSLPAVNIIPSTQPKQYLRFKGDKIGLVTAQDLFEQNKNITDVPAQQLTKILPTPVAYAETGEAFALPASVNIAYTAGFENEAAYLRTQLNAIAPNAKPVHAELLKDAADKAVIHLEQGTEPEGAYSLEVTGNGVTIKAGSATGIFYGIQSLLQLVPVNVWAGTSKAIQLPGVKVYDAPRFGYRAFMLDVGRNFKPKSTVKKVLDLMALYKLNTFHFHITDDEGWRIEIAGLPELTAIGSQRGYTATNTDHLQPAYGSGPDVNNTQGSGYYTKADFIELLQYANQRHIQVIPEIEAPGHARAASRAMFARYQHFMAAGDTAAAKEYLLHDVQDASKYSSVQNWNDNVIDPAMPSVYHFMEKVVDELRNMYAAAGAPLTTIHMGGDEVPAGVWEKSPAFAALKNSNSNVKTTEDVWYYFYGKLNNILQQRRLFLSGWEETALRKTKLDGKPFRVPNPDFIATPFQVDVWNNVLGDGDEDLAYKLANAGYKVVLSCVTNNYLDMAYYKDFDEPGYYWGAFIDIDKPYGFIPFDYFKNAVVDKNGNAVDQSLFVGKQRLTDYGKSNIVGVKGLLWAETLVDEKRLEYMLLPKLLGIAERAWAKDPEWATADKAAMPQLYRQAWNQFVNRIGKFELPRLDYYGGGYQYRIPVPGAAVINGAVTANIQLPGLVIRYTTNGKTPDTKSALYTGPVTTKGTITFKAFDTRGRSGRAAVIVNP